MSYNQAAVINANAADIRDLFYVSAGELVVSADVTNNATNLGFLETIPWSGMRSYEKIAYSAGAQKVIKINFDSALHGWYRGQKCTMTIKFYDPTEQKNKAIPFTVYVKDTTPNDLPATEIDPATVCDQFYSLLNISVYPWTVVQTTTKTLTITFAIGTTALNATEPTIEMPWVDEDTEHNITGIADSSGTKVTITSSGHGLSVGDMIDIYDVTWTAVPTAGDFKRTGYQVTDSATTFKVAFVITGGTYNTGGHWKEVVQMTSTAYAKADGTPSIVEANAPGGSTESGTYVTYVLDYFKDVRSDHGLYAKKQLQAVVYIDTDLTEEIAYFDALLAGTVVPALTFSMTKANPGVVTTTAAHCLSVGDKVVVGLSKNNPTLLPGVVMTVVSVDDVDEFTTDFDASSITGAETAGKMYLFQPEKYYLGK